MEKTTREIIADNLAALMERTRAYRSQPLLAKKSGISQSTVGRVLRAEVDSGNDTLQALAKVFKLTAADLLDPNLSNRGAETAPADRPADAPLQVAEERQPYGVNKEPLEASLLSFFRNLDPKRQAKLVAIAADMYAEQAQGTTEVSPSAGGYRGGGPAEKSSAGTHG